MFSGLTNQFSSLVGAVKGGQTDEDVPAPTADAVATEASTAAAHQEASDAAGNAEQPVEGEEGAKSHPSLVNSFISEASGWLGSAKGWLGNASIPSMPAIPTMSMPSMPAMPNMPSIPSIPGLRKGGADAGEGAAEGGAEHADATGAVSGEDDDKSRYISATEGADSHPASGGGTPTGEEGQIGHGKGEEVKITTKVTQQAKHFGSFLSSAINKASSKIKETVKDNNILDSFNKEQEAFIKGQSGLDSGAAPWIGHTNEGKIKEEILGLSQDRRNFVRAPPAGVEFEFNYDTSYPTAIAIMAEDKALETMRFELVPKIITEENFWRNYFYRVSLIIQAAELGTLGADGVGQASSGEDAKTLSKIQKSEKQEQKQKQKITASALIKNEPAKPITQQITKTIPNDELTTTISQEQILATAKTTPATKKESAKTTVNKTQTPEVKKLFESEFVSDAFQTDTETDLEEIKDGMRKLGIDSMNQQALYNEEEQWEKELDAELREFEFVSGSVKSGSSSGGGTRSQNKTATKAGGSSGGGAGGGSGGGGGGDGDKDDELPTISNLRTRSTNNDWEEYADLIEDTDDLK